MTLIVCLDNNNGMLFNKRRQSRDARVCERILQVTAGRNLVMNAYSAKLFPAGACAVSEDLFANLDVDTCVFAECEIPSDIFPKVQRLIVYRWNRTYPSDVKFRQEAIIGQLHKMSTVEFQGNSHDVITEEVYIR